MRSEAGVSCIQANVLGVSESEPKGRAEECSLHIAVVIINQLCLQDHPLLTEVHLTGRVQHAHDDIDQVGDELHAVAPLAEVIISLKALDVQEVRDLGQQLSSVVSSVRGLQRLKEGLAHVSEREVDIEVVVVFEVSGEVAPELVVQDPAAERGNALLTWEHTGLEDLEVGVHQQLVRQLLVSDDETGRS